MITDEAGEAASFKQNEVLNGKRRWQNSPEQQQGMLASFFSWHEHSNTRRKAYQMIVTQVLYKQIFNKHLDPLGMFSFFHSLLLYPVRFDTAFKGTGRGPKTETSGEEAGQGEKTISSPSLCYRIKKHTTCENHLFSLQQCQHVWHWCAERLERSCVDIWFA